MSDLSRLLDDVYGDTDASAEPAASAPAPTRSGLPDWAIDSVLDEAFADWVPGPPTVAVGVMDAPSEHVEHVVGNLQRSAFADLTTAPAAAPDVAHAWSRSDDDILPGRRGRAGKQGRSAGAPAPVLVVAAGIESFAAAEEPAPSKGGRFRRRSKA